MEFENNDDSDLKYIYFVETFNLRDCKSHHLHVNVMQNCKLLHKIEIKETVYSFQNTIFTSISVINMTPTELLNNTTYIDELTRFINTMVEYETNRILEENWLSDYKKLNEEKHYYNSLNDEEKLVFANAQAYIKMTDILKLTISQLINRYELNIINSCFNNIKFVEHSL